MNFRLTAILLGALMVLLVAVLVTVLVDRGPENTVADAGLLEPLARQGVKEKDVDTVELVRTEPAEEKLLFVKSADGKWELREPFAGKADAAAVDGLVRDLFRAKPTKYAELTDNLALHGLDKPTLRITVKAGGDKSETISVGNTTIGADKAVTFVTTAAAPKRPLAVKRSDLAAVFRDSSRGKDGPAWQLARWAADYRPRKLLAADARDPLADMQGVKLTAGGSELALNRTPAGVWKIDAPAGYGEADDLGDSAAQPSTAPFTGVRPLLTALTALQAGPDDYIEKPGDLAQYGLKPGDPAAVRVEVRTKSGSPDVLVLGKPVPADPKAPPTAGPQVYARLDGDSAVIKVATDRVEAIRQTATHPGDLRNKDLLPPTKRAQIDAVDLTVGGATVKLRKVTAGGDPAPRWVLYGGPGDPQDARPGEVETLLMSLAKPRAARDVLPAPSDAAFAPGERKATVKVWADGVEKPEKPPAAGQLPADPKLKGTPTELVFGKKEGDAVFVRRTSPDGSADLTVADPLLGLVTKSRLDYLDPKVKSFDTQAAKTLAFNRGAEPFALTKQAGATPWVFDQPAGRKGQAADADKVSGLLGLLASLSADKVVAEQPAPDALKKYGLDPAAPRLKVTVALPDPADKERVYTFGAETDDHKSVYAAQAGRPIVFVVPKAAADRFLTDDLRDPTLYRLDAAKVKRLRVRGWKGLVTQDPLVLQFEKKGADWAAVPPTQPGYKPDPAKLAALLAALSTPRATAFVDTKLDTVKYGLDVAQNPDGLEVTIESDGTPPLVLLLGGKAPGGTVYGATSAVPNEVFTLDPAAIRSVLEKPASLQK